MGTYIRQLKLATCGWIRRIIGGMIARVYFKYFFNQDEVIQNFIVHFIPDNLSGANPRFFVTLVERQAKARMWEAEVRIDRSGYRIAYIRENRYE